MTEPRFVLRVAGVSGRCEFLGQGGQCPNDAQVFVPMNGRPVPVCVDCAKWLREHDIVDRPGRDDHFYDDGGEAS